MNDDADAPDGLAKARAGDPEAAQRLVDRLYPVAAKIVRAYLPRGCSEEDWLQEVFLRVFSRLDQYRADAPLEHWVAKLSVRVCLDALRARRRRPELRWSDLEPREAALVAETAGDARGGGPSDLVAARELTSKLLETLGADDRVIVTMLDIEQRSVAEVARLTGRTSVGVKVRAMRARRKLQSVLTQLLGEQNSNEP